MNNIHISLSKTIQFIININYINNIIIYSHCFLKKHYQIHRTNFLFLSDAEAP